MILKKIYYYIISIFITVMLAAHSFAADIRYDKNIKTIAISGDIVEGDYEKVKKILEENDVKYAVLASRGGRADQGMNIGMLFHLKKIYTLVPDNKVCISSCAFIWMGGVKRYMGEKARIGFHRPYHKDTGKNTEPGFGILSWQIGFYNFSWKMVDDIRKTNKDKIIYFDEKVAERWFLQAYIISRKE